jgi:hypothetical protein
LFSLPVQVLLLNTAFCVTYLVTAVLYEQASEMLVFVAATVVVTVYVVLNCASSPHFPDPSTRPGLVKLLRLVFVAVFGAVLIPGGSYLAWRYKQSNSLVFRTVGADFPSQTGCRLLYSLHSMLKFHVQVEASMVALAIDPDESLSLSARDVIVIISGVLFIVGTRLMVYLALRLESRILCFSYWPLSLIELGFVSWKYYDAVNAVAAGSVILDGIFFTGTVCILFQLAINLTLFVYERNYFGKGLTEKVYGESCFVHGRAPDQCASPYRSLP